MQETARVLEKTPCTLTAWVRAGRIKPLDGTGGQGRRALFDPVAVAALRAHDADCELLARVRFAFEQDRAGKWREYPPWNMFPGVSEYLRAKNPKAGAPNNIELVALADVPANVKAWARRAVNAMESKQVRYLTAMFLASEYPPRFYDRDSEKLSNRASDSFADLSRAIGMRLKVLWRYRVAAQYAAYRRKLAAQYKFPIGLFENGTRQEQRERLGQWVSDVLFGMMRSKDYNGLKQLVFQLLTSNPKEKNRVGDIIRYAKLENAQAKLKFAFPSPPAVASVLGLTRMQGWRIWDGMPGAYCRELNRVFNVKHARADIPVINVPAASDASCPACDAPLMVEGDTARCSVCTWRTSKAELIEIATAKENEKILHDQDKRARHYDNKWLVGRII